MTEKQRMLKGMLHRGSPEMMEDRLRKDRITAAINAAPLKERPALFRELFGDLGEGAWIEVPFYCDYGSNIHIGKNFYANFGCVILDVCDVTIGDNVFFAPYVCIFPASHPIDAGTRDVHLECGKPVKIGSSVWVGGHTVINPGVTIGDDVVIGSGSVVTKDIPSHVIAAGNPCRVLREITEEDQRYWEGLAEEYWQDPDRGH